MEPGGWAGPVPVCSVHRGRVCHRSVRHLPGHASGGAGRVPAPLTASPRRAEGRPDRGFWARRRRHGHDRQMLIPFARQRTACQGREEQGLPSSLTCGNLGPRPAVRSGEVSCGTLPPGQTTNAVGSSPSPSTTPSPASSPQAVPSTSPTADTAGVARCSITDLAISDRFGGVGASSWVMVLIFRDVASAACVLGGYPGVAGLNASHQQVLQAVRTPSGYGGGLPVGQTKAPVVLLAPGGEASALVEGSDFLIGTATSCLNLAGLLVTPPGSRHSVALMEPTPDECFGLQVHPVVPGPTGSEG